MDYIQADEHREFLGASFVKRQHDVVLRIGEGRGAREWTRSQLVQSIGVGNWAAAAKLTTVLRKMKIRSLEELYAVDPRDFALIPKLGETTVFVAMAVLKSEEFDVKHWIKQIAGERKKIVTFRTLKLQRRERKR